MLSDVFAAEEAAMLKPLFLVSAVILFAAPSVLARNPQDAAPAPVAAKSTIKTTAESQAHAKKIYEVDCALCHNSNGDGKTDLAKGMELKLLDWTDPKSLSSMSDKEIFDAIRKGKGKMPPEEESRAKDEVVWNLVVYLRSLSSKDQPAPAPSN